MKDLRRAPDKELILNYLKGDIASIEVLINRYKSNVYAYILKTVKDPVLADDLFQDTFIKAIQTLRSGVYREEGKFNQWVNKIAHNLIIDHYRKGKRSALNDSIDCVEQLPNSPNYATQSIEDSLINSQKNETLMSLIEQLPPEQCEVVKLRHYCDLSFKDIASITNVSINTALGRMRYAIINLRKIIEEQNITILGN